MNTKPRGSLAWSIVCGILAAVCGALWSTPLLQIGAVLFTIAAFFSLMTYVQIEAARGGKLPWAISTLEALRQILANEPAEPVRAKK